MNARRVLVPIDIARCPLEVFARVNAYAQGTGATVILLHVVNLNLAAPDRRIDADVCADARWNLERLVENYVVPDATILIHVRMGKPGEEILAEAEAENVDLIILPVFATSGRRRGHIRNWFTAAIWPHTAKKLLRSAQCPVLIVHEDISLNCQQNWGRSTEQLEPALYHLHTTTGARPLPESPEVTTHRECRAA